MSPGKENGSRKEMPVIIEGDERFKVSGNKFVVAVAVATSLYHFLFITGVFQRAGFYIYSDQHYGISLGLILSLAFLIYPAKRGQPRGKLSWYDILFIIGAVASCGYHVFFPNLVEDHLLASAPSTIETFLAIILPIVLMEAVRRIMGIALPILAAIFVIYVFICGQLPGLLNAVPINLTRAVCVFYLSPSGIFGMIVRIYSMIIFPFVLFSSFFQVLGASQFFMDLAMSTAGSLTGGPAKVAIVSSALMGTVSGSGPAVAAATGSVSIPLMKKLGYAPDFAGGVEAVASNGGGITPPVMAIVAFIMSEVTGIPYIQICLAAILPCILYYTCLMVAVHLEALRTSLRALPKEELLPLWPILMHGSKFLIPIAGLVLFMAVWREPAEVSALYSVLILIIVAMFGRKSRVGPKKVISGLDDAARTMLVIGPACGLVGVIFGSLNASGIGVSMTGALVDLAGGNLAVLLMLAAVLCFIMGMGLDPITIYVLLSALVAPILEGMGVAKMAAHFFILYWGLVALITPPVCATSFVAAGIAGSDPWKTGWQATRLGISTFILPFAFVYSPALFLKGPPLDVIFAVLSGLAGSFLLAVGIIGYFISPLIWFQRAAVIMGSLFLIFPGWRTDIVGVILALVGLFPQVKSIITGRARSREAMQEKLKVGS
jgi:TRAP transporter 4TM/12TM fusion protein